MAFMNPYSTNIGTFAHVILFQLRLGLLYNLVPFPFPKCQNYEWILSRVSVLSPLTVFSLGSFHNNTDGIYENKSLKSFVTISLFEMDSKQIHLSILIKSALEAQILKIPFLIELFFPLIFPFHSVINICSLGDLGVGNTTIYIV